MTESRTPCPPLLKWPGGKRGLLPHINSFLPENYSKYFEPFAGGAALFFSLAPQNACLADTNPHLINCYEQVRDQPEALIRRLRSFRNDEESYYQIRSMIPRSRVGQAAQLLYLTTLSFNGIYRMNLRGEFNVPYGYKTHLKPFDAISIRRCSKLLSRARLKCADFEVSVKSANKGDFIYFDPPYTVAHGNNGFLKYNDTIFSWEDQKRLADVASALKIKGCYVMVSNADHPSIRELYPNFVIHEIRRHSVIAASSCFRKEISEVLMCSWG